MRKKGFLFIQQVADSLHENGFFEIEGDVELKKHPKHKHRLIYASDEDNLASLLTDRWIFVYFYPKGLKGHLEIELFGYSSQAVIAWYGHHYQRQYKIDAKRENVVLLKDNDSLILKDGVTFSFLMRFKRDKNGVTRGKANLRITKIGKGFFKKPADSFSRDFFIMNFL